MEWFTKHIDAMVIISVILGAVVWMNGEFNDVKREISDIRVDIAVVKTVLIMKKVLPAELAQKERYESCSN